MKSLRFKEYIAERIKNRCFLSVLLSYICFCIFSALALLFTGRIKGIIMSFLFLAFVPLLFILEYFVGLRFDTDFAFWAYLLAVGSILGSCYNMYSFIPFFDTALHGLSGILFAMFGFMLAERFFGGINSARELFGCIIFGVFCSLSVAVLWEIFEYCGESFFGMDSQADSFISEIRSHLLAGSNNDMVVIEDIKKTVIHYSDGKTYVVDGYLDTGRNDTLIDMIICAVGAVAYIPFAFSRTRKNICTYEAILN